MPAAPNLIQPEFRVSIDAARCRGCGRCVRECGWGVYTFDDRPVPDHAACRACHRCVACCPGEAITIEKNRLACRDNSHWPAALRTAVWRQAQTGSVLLTGNGTDIPYVSIFDHLVLDACQVTNPPIDPLREPMEMRTYLGARPDRVQITTAPSGYEVASGSRLSLERTIRLETPIVFAPMSYGAVSLNVQKSIALAASRSGTLMNTGEGGLHADLREYGDHMIVQVASGRFGVDVDFLNRGVAVEIKVGQGAKPGIGGHLPGEKADADIAETRMIPRGADAISPAPHHDIYSIEDLRQLIFSIKEATGGKPVGVKIATVHNVAAIASGIVRAGADYVYLDGFRGGTGAAPRIIRDHMGIPLEIALAVVDERLREEGIRERASLIAAGSIRSSADLAKAIALGADAVAIGSAALVALGCHLCQGCHTGSCSWGLTTQRPELTRRLDPEWGADQLTNLLRAWTRELKEICGAMGVNAIESLRGSRERLRTLGLDERTSEILGVKPAGL